MPVSTADTGFTGTRKRVETAAPVSQHGARVRITAALSEGTRAWMIEVRAGNPTGSWKYVE